MPDFPLSIEGRSHQHCEDRLDSIVKANAQDSRLPHFRKEASDSYNGRKSAERGNCKALKLKGDRCRAQGFPDIPFAQRFLQSNCGYLKRQTYLTYCRLPFRLCITGHSA